MKMNDAVAKIAQERSAHTNRPIELVIAIRHASKQEPNDKLENDDDKLEETTQEETTQEETTQEETTQEEYCPLCGAKKEMTMPKKK